MLCSFVDRTCFVLNLASFGADLFRVALLHRSYVLCFNVCFIVWSLSLTLFFPADCMCFLLMIPLSDADRAGCYAFSFIGCLCSVSTLPSFDADRVGHITHSQEVRALFRISLHFMLIISCIPRLQLVSAWF